MDKKRKYLQELEIVGATMAYREGDIICWTLDWLYANCDRVCILLDNYDEKTKDIIYSYKKKYPKIPTNIVYSDVRCNQTKNKVSGHIKHRFKQSQGHIRENVIRELKKMNDEKKIDLLVWPDSDEIFIDRFPQILEDFWNNKKVDQLVLGFIEVYDNFRIILNQRMFTHGRVYKYDSRMTAIPYKGRTKYFPYRSDMKIRNVVIHLCHFTEEQRENRRFITRLHVTDPSQKRMLWFLPEDVRKIDSKKLRKYNLDGQVEKHEVPGTPIMEYLNNKEKYYEFNRS